VLRRQQLTQSRLHSSSLDGAPMSPLSPESVTSPEVDAGPEGGLTTPKSFLPPLAPVYTPAAAAGSMTSSATYPEARYYCLEISLSTIGYGTHGM
jgi:hypothetical protein